MRFFQFRLPSLLALLLLSCPLASRADQAQTDQTAEMQSTSMDPSTMAQQLVTVQDYDVLLTDQQLTQTQTSTLTDTDVDQLPVQTIGVDQPVSPADPGSSAVAPEPSSLVLLATGLLFGTLVWNYQRS